MKSELQFVHVKDGVAVFQRSDLVSGEHREVRLNADNLRLRISNMERDARDVTQERTGLIVLENVLAQGKEVGRGD